MFVGTGSDVGKSVIAAAFCRIFAQDGYRPAPFKAQNMSLNSYATPEGLEIGRAQAVQAEACGIPCESDMNPVLLKPTGDMVSQVVLHGKPAGNRSAAEYFNETDRDALFAEVMGSYRRLESRFNPVVIEGAGSISELNLKDRDITNMRVALAVGATVLLVADIDRGGVFGSVYGTIALLPPDERAMVKGIIINKFRGDLALFEDGRRLMAEITGVPVVAVIPWYHDIHIDQEDSVVLSQKRRHPSPGETNIAVVLLDSLSNFTDFDALEQLPGVNLYYTDDPAALSRADFIVIPGSKNTIADMRRLREKGLDAAILDLHRGGRGVYGVCGGYQMMGETIEDPHGVEGLPGQTRGLGILPVATVLTREKVTEQRTFTFLDLPERCRGYEIHMGTTTAVTDRPLCTLANGGVDGYSLSPLAWGTYIHGIFDNTPVIRRVFKANGLPAPPRDYDYPRYRDEQYDRLASHVRGHTDMARCYRLLES